MVFMAEIVAVFYIQHTNTNTIHTQNIHKIQRLLVVVVFIGSGAE